MEWTQALIPIVSSCAMTIAAMPLFIGYFQMKSKVRRFVRRDQSGTIAKPELLQWAA